MKARMPQRPAEYAGYRNIINGDKYLGRRSAVKFIDGVKYRHVTRFGGRQGPVWVRAESLAPISDEELLKLLEGEINSFSAADGFRLG